jgi:hypothetical protein
MILLVFAINARTRVKAKETGNNFILLIAHALDGGLIGYLISSTFLTVLFYPMFWFQLAMTVALYQISNGRFTPFPRTVEQRVNRSV